MDPNLTDALAQKNPNAYRARFKRLTLPQQQAFVAGLAPTAFVHHSAALGQPAVARVDLSPGEDSLQRFGLVFGGLRVVKEGLSWADAATHLSTLLAGLPSSVTVEGSFSVPSEPARAAAVLARFPTLGWKVDELHLTTSDPSDGGRVRFAFAVAAVIISGSTGRGALRGYAGLGDHELAPFEPGWAALARSLGVAWRRT